MIQAELHPAKQKILAAAMNLIRAKGYAATRVEDICQAVGLTKGGFFHHFSSKEEMAKQAAEYFGCFAADLFSTAPYQKVSNPVQKLLSYIDFRTQIITGEIPEFTCLLGTMVQEVHATHPDIREACRDAIWGHAETITELVAEAEESAGIQGIDPQEISLYIQAVLQGSFILAKASQEPQVARACMKHLRAYIANIFEPSGGGSNSGGSSAGETRQ